MAAGGDDSATGGGIWLKDLSIACDVGHLTETPIPVTSMETEMCRMSRERSGDTSQIAIMRLYSDGAL